MTGESGARALLISAQGDQQSFVRATARVINSLTTRALKVQTEGDSEGSPDVSVITASMLNDTGAPGG